MHEIVIVVFVKTPEKFNAPDKKLFVCVMSDYIWIW